MPNFMAFSATCWADICPANGVLLRLPLKPQVPALAQQSVSPLVSAMVMTVLLNVALMWATPTVTLRRTFFRVMLLLSLPWPRWKLQCLSCQWSVISCQFLVRIGTFQLTTDN